MPDSHAGRRRFSGAVLALGLIASNGWGAGSNGLAPLVSFLLDAEPVRPVPVLATSAGSPGDTNPIPVSVDFGEHVTGLETADFNLVNGSASSLVDLDGRHYTLDITAGASGTVSVQLVEGAAENEDGLATLASNTLMVEYAPGISVYLDQDFDALADGSPWPAPWQAAQGSTVVSATIEGGRACLEGLVLTGTMPASGEQNLARMVTQGLAVGDFEASFQLFFEDPQNQGLGFYGLQNGGFFTLGAVPGEGYGLFIRGYAGTNQLTFWYEDDGDEILHQQFDLLEVLGPGNGALGTATYNVRYQVEYIDAGTGTMQRARMWLDGTEEPSVWNIIDDTGIDFPAINPMTVASLQNITGGFALDVYNFNNPSVMDDASASICMDNLLITDLQHSAGPLELTTAPALVADSYLSADLGFLEGPVWRETDQLLMFSDISNDRIFALDPGDADSLALVRDTLVPPRRANGLANAVNGDLLIAEQASQSLVNRTPAGSESTLAADYLSTAFNSPNDLVGHSAGAVFFSDPTYGTLFEPTLVQGLGFQGIYRLDPLGQVDLVGTFNQPNGVALSPDQSRLYVTDTANSEVRVFELDANGNVTGELVVEMFSTADGGGGGDGIKVDTEANLFIAVNNGVWVRAADGGEWGLIATPQPVRNIAFGDADHRSLYLTLGDLGTSTGSVYRMRVNIPGIVAPASP